MDTTATMSRESIADDRAVPVAAQTIAIAAAAEAVRELDLPKRPALQALPVLRLTRSESDESVAA
jgi:hypothetical protein